MRAVLLVLALADIALEAGPHLGTNADAIALLDLGHVLTDLDGLADHLVTDTERTLEVTPAAGDGVNVGPAHAAALNLDVDVVIAKRLGLELVTVELVPGLGRVNDEALESLWVAHFECWLVVVVVVIRVGFV